MANYISGEFIKELRRRKGLQQAYMQKLSGVPENLLITLSRVENLHQQPTQDTMKRFLDLLGMPIDRYFCPYLESRSPDTELYRERLLFYLDYSDVDDSTLLSAKETLARLSETLDGDSIINRQFILSCRARLCVIDGAFDEAEALVKEGLLLTFPEFDFAAPGDEIFIFEEVDLLHTLAMVYIYAGRAHDAIALLDRIHVGSANTPIKDVEKDKKLPKVLWLLSKCLMDNKDYENALAKCEAGLKIAIDHVVGRHVSDLVYTKALCLCHLGRRDEGEVFLYYAYFCYLLQGDKKGADKVWQHARDVLGINIQTYGAENLAHSRDVAEFEPVGIPFASAEDNIGSVIRGLRLHAGLPAKAIYSGLCSKGNYSLIESGKVKQADISLLRAIFQRLGRDINLFFTAFLSKDEIDEMNLRDEVRNLLIDWKFDEAAAPLEELRKLPSAKTRLGQQYLMLFDINMLRGREGFTQAFLDLTHEALAITIPDFDEEKIENYRLSHMEATLINVLAAYYSNTGDWPRSRDVYSRLINNLKRFCVDEPELIAIYTAALSNYISFMLRTEIVELCKDVYPLADECIKLCKRYGRFHMLPKTYGNIGYALDGEGRLEECIPYFAMAYYGHVIAGDLFNRKKLVEWLKERLGHTFVH